MKKVLKYVAILLILGMLLFQYTQITEGNNIIQSLKESTNQTIRTVITTVKSMENRLKTIEYQLAVLFQQRERKPDLQRLKLATIQIKFGRGGGAGITVHIDEDYIYVLTAQHIAKKSGEIQAVVRNKDESYIIVKHIPRANVVKHQKVDLALVKIPRPEGIFTSIAVAKKKPEIGDTIYTIGHPVKTYYSVNKGIVVNYFKRLFNNIKEEYLLVSAPSFSGNSGGAVVNTKTELVGLVVGIMYMGESPRPPKSKTVYLFHMTYATQLKFIQELLKEQEVRGRVIGKIKKKDFTHE